MASEPLATILVVDDEPGTLALQERYLTRAGYEVICARTIARAAHEVACQAIDLIILDHRLSGTTTGLEFHAELKQSGCDLPVIVVTAYSHESMVIEALRMGVRDFVSKTAEYLEYLPEAVASVLKQVRTEKELAQSRSQLASIVGCAMDALVTVDPDSKIAMFNAAAERMFGCSAEEALGQPISRFVVLPEDIANFGRKLAASPIDHFEMRVEMQACRVDGAQFPVEVSIWGSRAGNTACCTLAMRDLTERQSIREALDRKEEMLRQSQKLEAVGALSGGIAHEFNNLLQAITGYTECASAGLPEGSVAREDLNLVLEAGARATSLTRQLLSFARRQVLECRSIDANRLVTEVARLVRPLIGRQIELELSLDQDACAVHADPSQLQQILLNLCINARDAMPCGGRLTIETKSVEIEQAFLELHPDVKPGRYLTLSVSDTGCGMPPEVMGRVFEPFYTTKEVGAGTGLGLATVYGIVQQHQGAIHVYSEPGKGSAFRVYLPSADAAETLQQAVQYDSVVGGTETILVAEDEPLIMDLTVRILREAGYTTLTACNGEEALRVFLENPDRIDLALLDVNMPKRSGRTAYYRMSELRPDLKTVFSSGYSLDSAQVELPSGMTIGTLQKPFAPRALLQIVREVLDRQLPTFTLDPMEIELPIASNV